MICPHCRMEVPSLASKCPYCLEDPREFTNGGGGILETVINISMMVFFAWLAFVIIF